MCSHPKRSAKMLRSNPSASLMLELGPSACLMLELSPSACLMLAKLETFCLLHQLAKLETFCLRHCSHMSPWLLNWKPSLGCKHGHHLLPSSVQIVSANIKLKPIPFLGSESSWLPAVEIAIKMDVTVEAICLCCHRDESHSSALPGWNPVVCL